MTRILTMLGPCSPGEMSATASHEHPRQARGDALAEVTAFWPRVPGGSWLSEARACSSGGNSI